ncbi:MAG: hypothetical protein JRI75_08445 [Deltaproteobacteria bacterium]|nr:hypothetical protein [Deltaproteobacteria bacterium]
MHKKRCTVHNFLCMASLRGGVFIISPAKFYRLREAFLTQTTEAREQ